MMKTITNGLAIILMLYLAYMLYEYAAIVGLIALVLTSLGAAGFLAFTAWFAYEKMMILHSRRIEAEKSAHVMVVTQGLFVGIRDTSKSAGRWQVYSAPRADGHSQAPQGVLLPASINPVDLLAALDPVQRCLIVGPSDTGKTTLLQHLVTRRQSSSKVIVIDPHAYPDKWPGCHVAGAGRNYAEIGRALDALVKLMVKRYDEIGRGLIAEMGHPRFTILIDEWRAIVYNLGEPAREAIKALLTESRKAAFSVFVASHSERVKALGIEGEGDLKDGFAVVRLSLVNGQRQATLDLGNGPLPTGLPGPFHGSRPNVIDGDAFELDPGPGRSNLQPGDLTPDTDFIRDVRAGISQNELIKKHFDGMRRSDAIAAVKQKKADLGLD